MKDVSVGVDIGGSHIGVGIVDSKGKILDSREILIDNTTLTPTDAVKIISENAKEMVNILSKVQPHRIISAGIGCPGQAFNGVIVAASNLPHFKNAPLAELMSTALNGVSVTLVNDADAAISAEVWGTDGIYDNFSNIAMITLGTGVGFGLILDRQLYQGSYGLIEGGHMIVSTSPDSRQCGCGQKGCVEAYSSAKNTALRLAELDAKDGTVIDPTSITGKEAFSRYSMNDYNAVNVIEEVR
jgi:glucokinase